MSTTKTLVLLVGLPRAGKTTHAKKLHARDGIPIVNPDSIRLALHGQRFLEAGEPMVWAIARYMVAALFLAGHDTVLVDATHASRKRRDFWRDARWRRAWVTLDTPREVCLERAHAAGDTEIVPVINRMAAQWEPVAADEIDP